jgi:hypothetical protein
MPTKPLELLLYREFQKANGQEIINIASPLLQEIVNYSTNFFNRCQESSKGEADEDLPILISYLHMIEMTDGIEVLISQSCPIPATPLLRSSFEAFITIKYLLKDDYKRKAFAWMVTNTHERLDSYRQLDPNHPKGKELSLTLESDETAKYFNLPTFPNLGHAVLNLENLLVKPNYKDAEKEYQNRKKHGRPEWYNLYNGPSTLRELARSVGDGALYDILYRQWSHVTHAANVSRFITKGNENKMAFQPLRRPDDIAQVTKFSASFMLDATRNLLGKFRPGEENNFRAWYITEVRENFFHL